MMRVIWMIKRYYWLIIIFILVFLLIPFSFASDNNLTVIEQTDADYESLSDGDSLNEIHVDVNGNDNNDGKSTHPLASIQKAINLSGDNSKIVVHEGIYRENNLNITKSLEIHGQGDVIIDAEGKSRIFTINTADSDSVLLSGITFANGRAYQGGAIYVRGAVTTIDNSRFINNFAFAEGGAVYWNSENGKLINSVIENNSARDGAGIMWGESETDFSIGGGDYGQIINCTFSNNQLQQDDDACIGLSIYSNSMKVINSRFINHKTPYNSSFGVLYINGDWGTVEGCLFENNTLTLSGALGLDGNYAVARGNTFINNKVTFNDSFGGAIGIQSETGNICNNTFISNGGENCVGGAVFINMMESHQFSFINITDNYFKDNTGLYGGVVYCYGQNYMLTLIIKNNTFDSSRADVGGVAYLKDIYDPVYVINNTFRNTVSNSASGIYAYNCILDLSNNVMENCTSSDCDIWTYGEIRTPVHLKFNDVTAILGEETNLTATLLDDDGNTVFTRDISFKVEDLNITGKKGMNSFLTTFDRLGKYTITGEYRYGASTVENGTLTVVNGAYLSVENITSFSGNVEISVDLTDSLNNPISNVFILVNVKGNDVLLTTDSSGHASAGVKLDIGQYNLTARLEDSRYSSMERNFTVTVMPSIDAADLKRAYNSPYDFKAQFYNGDGTLLNSSSVAFTVKGVKYNLTTDSNGIAVLNAKLSPGSYNVIVHNLATGDEASYSLEVVERIAENSNITIYYGADAVYKVRVFDDDGNPVGADEIVNVSVDADAHEVKTDDDGYASFRIDLKDGTYRIAASYSGAEVLNKVVVKPVLTAKNISKKKAKKIKFSAKLVNTNGKADKGKKITFKVNGKKYTAKTNKKGIATITLKNLKAGKYKIKTKYAKSSIKNTIRIKK